MSEERVDMARLIERAQMQVQANRHAYLKKQANYKIAKKLLAGK